MLSEKPQPITDANLYAGFNHVSRALFKFWKKHIIIVRENQTTPAALDEINHHLLTDNVIVFFDHHYAFDAIPVSLALGQKLQHVAGAVIPYAAHLDMSVDPEGLPSLRYWLRTQAFQRLIENIQKMNPSIRLFPVVREFELTNPRLKAIVDEQHRGANTKYLKALTQLFTDHYAGQVCILSPTAGLAFPEKPMLHPQVYRSMEIVQSKYGRTLPFYFVGAYPCLTEQYHYLAPLLTKHIVVARGPFYLPIGNYEQAMTVVNFHLQELRLEAQFTQPDYERIRHK